MKQMKRFFILLFALLLGNLITQAQVSKKMESFRAKVFTEYSVYFSQVELIENGQLSLSALDNYFIQSMDDKIKIMENLTSKWQESLVLVHLGSQNELWGRSNETGKAKLIDTWNLNGAQPIPAQTSEPQKFIRHPWFFYIGEQGMIDSNHNINLSLNTRLGFFLLLNRWDLAATYSANFMGNDSSSDITGQSNVGLMSKVYFPIKKYNISPNVGGELSLASYTDAQKVTTQSINESVLIGISWYVGFGSLDIGFRAGKEVTTMVGFTIFPNLKSKRK